MVPEGGLMSEVLFTNLRLLDPRDESLKSNVTVLVRDNLIQEVTASDVSRRGATEIDLGGRVLMPGLIDCHVHVTATHVSYGLHANKQLPGSLVTALAFKNLEAMAMRGFTSVRDAGGADRGHRIAMEQGLFIGPRLFIAGRAISQTGGHGDFRDQVDSCDPCACGCAHLFNGIGRVADGVSQVRQAARDEIRLGANHIKVMASGGVASASDPIHFLQYSTEELEALVDEATRADTYVMAHAYTPAAIRRAVEAGVRTIEHGNLIDSETADIMAKHGAYLVPTLVTYEALAKHGQDLGFPEESLAKLANVVAVGTRSLEIARKAGVKIAIGSDLLGELQRYQSDEFRIRSAAQSPAEIIRSATLVGAEVLRREGKLGVIAAGALADLIVVDGNPLDDIGLLAGQGEHLPVVMKEGRFLKNRL
jgi:imidazolonepropionase-like amidohydrolase